MCVLHAARDNRCAYNIVVVLTIPLQLPWCCLYITIPTPLCCAHVIVLPNRCASYHAHYSNVRQVFSVSILYFLQCLVYFGIILVTESFVAFSTIIARSYRAWQRTLCVSYYNIIYVLFLPYYSAKIQSVRKLALKIGQKSLLLYVVFITSLGCSNPRITRHKKYTAFRGVCVLSRVFGFLSTFACQRDESGSHELSGYYFLRSRYSPLAVSTEITSPVLIKAGTLTTRPVSSVASLSTLLVVSPFTTSSV